VERESEAVRRSRRSRQPQRPCHRRGGVELLSLLSRRKIGKSSSSTTCACMAMLSLAWLMRWRGVSREWREKIHKSLPLLRRVSFPVGVTGGDVLRALDLVAGGNINIVDLRGCSVIRAEHMAWIVALVREKSPGATEINIEGCSDWAVVR